MPAANVPSRPSPPRTWFSCAGRSLDRRDSSRGKGRRPALCSRAAALPQRRATPGGLSFGGAGGAGALCRLRDGGGRHAGRRFGAHRWTDRLPHWRSEEHTSELQSLMRISCAVFCLKKKKEAVFTIQHLPASADHLSLSSILASVLSI